jgi:HEAT repeats/PRC-barrel domain
MDVAAGVNVECADGPCGRSQYVVLNPANATITHVVVGGTDMYAETRLVPLAYVSDSSPELIRLKCTHAELQALPLFSEYEYIRPEGPYVAYSPSELWMGPLTAYLPTLLPEEHQYVPKGELPIRRGAQVEAIDGHVGSVDEFLVEPGSGRIAHLVLREGHLWGRRDVVIPATEIDRIEQDTVYLKLNKERVGLLPQFRPGSKDAVTIRSFAARTDDTATSAIDGPGAIEVLVADLGSSDRTTREDARLSLVTKGAPAVAALAAALAGGGTQVRWEAAKALQQMADPEAAPALVAALEDSDSGVRWIAAEGLAILGRAGVVALLQALKTRSDSIWLRNGTHHVLRSIIDAGLQRDVAPVLAALEGTEPALEVPGAARKALVSLEEALSIGG